MKNFTKTITNKTLFKPTRWLIMTLMLLLGTSSAWGEMWINDTNGWNIEIERNGVSSWLGGNNGFSREDKDGAYKDYSASNSTSLTIKNAWVKASSNDGWQIRYVTLYYRVSTETNRTGNFTQLKCKDLGHITNASSSYFELSNINKSIIDGLSGGTYYLDYYFTVGNDGCDKGYSYAPEYNCSGNKPHPSQSGAQNCSYYSIKFKVPEQEKKYSLGGYIQVGNSMADKSTYYSIYDLAKQTDGTYKGTFSFSKSHNNAQYIYIVDNTGTIYGHQTNNYPMSPGNTTTLSNTQSNKVKATIALNTNYVFTFNPSTGAFTYSLDCATPTAPNVTGTTNVVKCVDNVTTNGTITIDNYVNTSTYKLQLGSNEAQTVTPTNGVFSVSANGIYTLTVTNSCGSSSSTSNISVGLTQNQVTISAISGLENICSGSSENYSITAIDGVTYNWSINSDKFTLGDNGTNSIQVTATGTADATATLTVTATKSGCPTTQTKSINLISPVKTASIKLTDEKGTPVANDKKYCVGTTAYIKVESDVKYATATWKSDLGVEVEQTGSTNIYQFEVKGKDQIVVLLSNKCNSEPVSSNPLEVDVYASPSVPEIALGASSICNTNVDGTTLTVTRTKSGQLYALYKEDGNGGIEVEEYQLCTSDNAEIEYRGLKEAAKYFVKTYTEQCPSEITRSSSATLTVVDSKDVNISIEPTSTETTPWMPVKLTVTATSDYTVTSVPNDAVINISGNIVKVKLPLPTEGVQNKSTTEDGVNVTFTNIPYTITAELKTAGEEGNPCAQPAIANITLKPYIEVCD